MARRENKETLGLSQAFELGKRSTEEYVLCSPSDFGDHSHALEQASENQPDGDGDREARTAHGYLHRPTTVAIAVIPKTGRRRRSTCLTPYGLELLALL